MTFFSMNLLPFFFLSVLATFRCDRFTVYVNKRWDGVGDKLFFDDLSGVVTFDSLGSECAVFHPGGTGPLSS